MEKDNRTTNNESVWMPYVDTKNVSQEEYDRLANSGGTIDLDDESARQLVAREFGFDPSKIVIQRSVPQYEIDQHRRLRKVGEIAREPQYNATDWNYVRFDVCGWEYEMYNGSLKFYL